MAVRRPKRTTNISFRLDDLNGERLAELAQKAGVSPHEYARGLVLEALAAVDQVDRLDQRLQATEEQLLSLRRDLAASILAIMTDIKDDIPEERVRDWLRRNGLLVR